MGANSTQIKYRRINCRRKKITLPALICLDQYQGARMCEDEKHNVKTPILNGTPSNGTTTRIQSTHLIQIPYGIFAN